MDDLFQALATLKGKGYGFRLEIVGTAPWRENSAGWRRSWNWKDASPGSASAPTWRTDWTGRTCSACPPWPRGNPQGLLEALARGLVPVARSVGGVPEVWPQGLEHLLAPPGPGPEGLTHSLESVLQADEETREAWKHIAWRKCVEDLNVDTQTAKLEEWMQKLAGG